jgi:hypothetical protein
MGGAVLRSDIIFHVNWATRRDFRSTSSRIVFWKMRSMRFDSALAENVL